MHAFLATEIGPYHLHDIIGEGAFAVVRLSTCSNFPESLACKVIPRIRLQSSNLDARFELEIRVIQQLHHPGVVQLIDLLSDDQNYYVFMEFCPGGELFQHVVSRGHLTESEAKPFLHQILEALKFVHGSGICHRDLKPENLLLDGSHHVKISDFGLSRFVRSDSLVTTPCGSPCYVSPECISGRPYDGRKSDIWSVGVIAFALLTGQLPWTKRNQLQLFEQIRKADFVVPGYLSHDCRNFILGLMTVDCSRRLTIDTALKHPWLTVERVSWGVPNDGFMVSLKRIDLAFAKEVTTSSLDEGGDLGLGHSAVFSGEQTSGFLKLAKPRIGQKMGFKSRDYDFNREL
jgi:serine/threonine protein kinase